MATPNTSKVTAYIEARIGGAEPLAAARLAGYAEGAGIKVVASRNESRADVREALRKAKRQPGSVVTAKRGPGQKKPARVEVPIGIKDKSLAPWKLKDHYDSPLDLLQDVMNNPDAPGGLRIQCAKDAMPYCHARKEGGKTEEKERAGKKPGGKFPTMDAPSHLRRAA
jgi:hypothetical protein